MKTTRNVLAVVILGAAALISDASAQTQQYAISTVAGVTLGNVYFSKLVSTALRVTIGVQ